MIPTLLLIPFLTLAETDAAAHLAKIKAVRAEGQGNAEASAAWKELVALGPPALLPTLAAMPERDLLVNNWLRAAVDAVAEKMMSEKQPLPAKELEAFVLDRKNPGPGRWAAYEWLVRADAKAPERLLPKMLDDTSGELRREAVAAVIKEGEELQKKNDKPAAITAYQKALAAAREVDQVDLLAKKLTELGEKVDVAAHYGYIQSWKLIAPFDNVAGVGFQAVYPPEKGVDLTKAHKGKKDMEVRWTDHTTKDPRGLVDLNTALGKHKGAVGYAYAIIDSPREQKIQIRAASTTAVKILLNGQPIFAREEYHHGHHVDQHIGVGTLKAGRNEILLKVCQNEQTESWAQDWKFQLRLCDELGGGVPFKVATPMTEKKEDKR